MKMKIVSFRSLVAINMDFWGWERREWITKQTKRYLNFKLMLGCVDFDMDYMKIERQRKISSWRWRVSMIWLKEWLTHAIRDESSQSFNENLEKSMCEMWKFLRLKCFCNFLFNCDNFHNFPFIFSTKKCSACQYHGWSTDSFSVSRSWWVQKVWFAR